MRTLGPMVVFVSMLTAGAAAQTRPPAPAAPAAPAKAEQEAAPDSFTYNPAGRRDPFVSLIGLGTDGRAPGKRAEGSAGLISAEISVKGIVQSRGTLIAMVQGPDNKTYVVHSGDKLADGTIKTITTQGLVIIQNVNDPLSIVKQREIRKQLRSLEEAKQ